ncbi:MAG: hypothetical protein K2M98_02105, partial [Muribaculum sp.]|nr:hypothetical protein [Muribaculum sp.]
MQQKYNPDAFPIKPPSLRRPSCYLCAIMKAQLYHTPSFHLRERRYVRPDYARAFRLWYDRHRRQ